MARAPKRNRKDRFTSCHAARASELVRERGINVLKFVKDVCRLLPSAIHPSPWAALVQIFCPSPVDYSGRFAGPIRSISPQSERQET
jgi:hypothetical protein